MEPRAAVTPPAADAVPAIEAVVHAGAVETPYRRAGCGPAVLLLFPTGADDPLAARLFARLARPFRVIAPRLPASILASDDDPAPFGDWLRDLIDGLGLTRPGLVVAAPLGPAALAFSRTDPDRASALIPISRDAPDLDDDEMIRVLETGSAVAVPGSRAPAEPARAC